MTRLALLDACVLVNQRLTSLLLTMASAGLFQPRWSEPILDETKRALSRKIGLSSDLVERRLNAMRDAFPEAAVVGFEPLAPGLTCDPKDRHVLAAAIIGAVDDLVTFNLKDFPDISTDPYGLIVLHPEEFLLDLLATERSGCRGAILRESSRLRRPSLTVRQLLAGLTPVAPLFANTAWNVFDELDEPTTNIPALVIAEEADSWLGQFKESPDLTNPLHVAFAWSEALSNRDRDVLDDLTWHPPSWRGYAWADEHIAGRGFATRVYEAVDDPTGEVSFVRLVPAATGTSQVIAHFTTAGGRFLTMKRRNNGIWCVWGLGDTMVQAIDVIEG